MNPKRSDDSRRSEPSVAQSPTFEEALGQLEVIVHELEEGEVGLVEGLARYEDGVRLLRQCYQLLADAQSRIELLNRVDADGNIVVEPFDEAAQSLEEKAKSRSRRRSRAGNVEAKSDLPPDAVAEPDPDAMDGPGRLF